jgi:hypothetical protein
VEADVSRFGNQKRERGHAVEPPPGVPLVGTTVLGMAAWAAALFYDRWSVSGELRVRGCRGREPQVAPAHPAVERSRSLLLGEQPALYAAHLALRVEVATYWYVADSS